MKKQFVFLMLLGFVLISFTGSETSLFVVPENWPAPSYDFSKNPLSIPKIELGRALFYEPLLSHNDSVSCSNCHSPFTAFAHVDHALSHGIDNRMGKRNAPALMNLAWQKLFMWDGAINHLDQQPLAPISNADEMNEDIGNVVHKLQRSKLYPGLFQKAFGDSLITGEHLLKAISQFMLTVISSNAKYDSVMRKQSLFTDQEANGYKLFQNNCAECHREPLFTNLQFENNGLSVDTTLNDLGRMAVTKNPADSLRFLVPSLRNIEFSYPYMHDGRFKTISDVLMHYTSGIQKNKTLSKPLLKPIVLSSNEKVDLTAFLLTLTDKHFLFDPRFSYPKYIFYPSIQN